LPQELKWGQISLEELIKTNISMNQQQQTQFMVSCLYDLTL